MTPSNIMRIANTLEKRGLAVGIPLILRGSKSKGRSAAYIAAAVIHELHLRQRPDLVEDVLDGLLAEAAREINRKTHVLNSLRRPEG